MGHAHELIAACLKAQGLEEAQALLVAETVMKVQVAAGIVSSSALEIWEREATIYRLRCQRVQVLAISERFGITKRQVFASIKRAMERRRAAFKAVS